MWRAVSYEAARFACMLISSVLCFVVNFQFRFLIHFFLKQKWLEVFKDIMEC